MDTLHGACWKTKANKEKAVKDAALAKDRAEMRQKVEQTTAASYAQAEGRARKPNKWGKKPPDAFDPSKEQPCGQLTLAEGHLVGHLLEAMSSRC